MKYRVADAHCDTVSEMLDRGEEFFSNKLHVSAEQLLAYDSYIQFFAAWVRPEEPGPLSRALAILDKFYIELKKNEDSMVLITDAETLEAALREKKIGAVLSIEDARAICGKLANLRMLYRLGVRAVTLTWNTDNDIADGAHTTSERGLTGFGREVVKEMNRLGMMVDVSHLSRRSFWDVLESSGEPVFASHSCCDAIFSHPRNLDDVQIRAIISCGGVIGLNLYPEFLTGSDRADTDDILRHAEHILSLGGENALGMGTDFDGIPTVPENISCAGELYRLFDKMKKIGYSDSLIDRISHQNLENYMRKILKNEKN